MPVLLEAVQRGEFAVNGFRNRDFATAAVRCDRRPQTTTPGLGRGHPSAPPASGPWPDPQGAQDASLCREQERTDRDHGLPGGSGGRHRQTRRRSVKKPSQEAKKTIVSSTGVPPVSPTALGGGATPVLGRALKQMLCAAHAVHWAYAFSTWPSARGDGLEARRRRPVRAAAPPQDPLGSLEICLFRAVAMWYDAVRWRLPFWVLFVAAAIPTAFLRHRDRRTVKPGCCRVCGYDLRASKKTSPECGTTTAPGPR